jgi:hypothetical protein
VKLERKGSQESAERRIYTTPRLVSFGKLEVITAGTETGTLGDMGTKKVS